MRPRFQADADFNQKVVAGLRRREPSTDFCSAQQGGVIGVPDGEILGIAAASGRILVSHDRKTMPGDQASSSCRNTSTSEDLLLIWLATDAEEWVDQVGFVPL